MKSLGSELLGRRQPAQAPAPPHASEPAAAPAPSGAARRSRRARAADTPPASALVWAFVAYLALEYLRPEALQALRLQMLFLLALPLLWLFSKQRTWSTNLTLQACFLATGAVMLPFARNNFEVYSYTRVMFTCFVMALAATWLMGYRRYFHRVVWSFVAVMCVQAVYAITHEGRGYGGFLGDENDLAIACIVIFPFGVVGFQTSKGGERWVWGSVAALMLFAIGVSFSRGGFLGLLAAAAYCLFFGRHRVRNFVLGGAAAALLFVLAPSEYKGEMGTIQDTDSGTAETRLFLWTTATRIWLDYPIMGVGGYNTKYRLGEYQPSQAVGELFEAPEFHQRDWSGLAVHSLYFETLADRGLVGVVLFAAIAILHFRTLRRLRIDARSGKLPPERRHDVQLYGLALEASMAGFLAAGAFLSMATYPHFWFLSAQAVALDHFARRPR